MTHNKGWGTALGAAVLMAAVGVQAQSMPPKPVAYPAKGQSAQQQATDDGACYSWAKQSTGVDPAVVAQAPPPQQAQGGQRVQGAARGAAAGAVGGAIAGDAGKGAAAGAAVGTVVGGSRHRQERRQAEATNQQTAANQQQAMGTYWQAWKACMGGKGYTVQ
ncbi:glycine zipper family protein [Cupriavidus campinensis]